jgi:D-serine dehydratase
MALTRDEPRIAAAAGRLPRPRRNADAIDDWRLDGTVKGFPASLGELPLGDVAARKLNVLAGDVPLPACVIRRSRMLANSTWMREFTRANGIEIAPHGKTTMAPQLFALQLQAGAWAISVATSQQLMVAAKFGVPRVIVANQPTGRAVIDACFAAVAQGVELLVLADSVGVIDALAEGALRSGSEGEIGILVELGAMGARTGARSAEDALAVARAATRAKGLRLRGFECFEGVLSNTEAVDLLLRQVLAAAEAAVAENLISAGEKVILSAGGTAFFDRVGEIFRTADLGGRERVVVIRSGCYLTHDEIGYNLAYERILAETKLKLPEGRLFGAMEVWASVQSRPERNRCLMTMGKRDVSYDSGMPVPLKWHRPGRELVAAPMPRGHAVTALNDQHAYLGTPGESPLAVGDMVGFGIGHPCTTFDKWQLIWIVDDDYVVVDAIRTFF